MRPLAFHLLLASLILVFGAGCKRIESKLDRLARAAGLKEAAPQKPASAPADTPLTPEQHAMEKHLQERVVFEAAKPEDLVPQAEAFALNKSAVVSILGYHDVHERGGSPMIIAASKFREQMQAIKESGIPVVPLSDVVAWRKGEKNIPEECFVITLDDGWQGVYKLAFPVLKEFGFPFTVYLYKKYVNIGGRSLTWDQLREMMKSGCEIGSHSVSHKSLRVKEGRSELEHQAWIQNELKESKEFLEQNLGTRCTSFAYPFGVYDDAMIQTAFEMGYETLVTVNGQKVTWDTPLGKLGRYIIHGESDTNFKLATSFRGRGEVGASNVLAHDAKGADGKPLVELQPAPDQVVKDRRPTITANLKGVGPIVPESVQMRVGGLGTVPATYDPAAMIVTYQLPYKLRRQDCAISISFKRDAAKPDEVVQWRFKVDLPASYVPKG